MNQRRRGHTLFELLISAGLIAVISGGVFALAKDSQAAFGSSLRTVRASRECTEALRRLRDDLEVANPTSLAITALLDGDAVSLQVPVAIAGGAITWGARVQQDGATVDFADGIVEYRIAQDGTGDPRLKLLRRVVDAGGVVLVADQSIVDDVDAPDPGRGKGLIVVRNGRLVTVTFRVRLSDDADRADAGEDLIKSQQITVRLRNT